MNINDVDAGENPIKSLADIFDHQRKLFWKYKDLEGMTWSGETVNVHTLDGQIALKDFLWRTTEELGESYQASVEHEDVIHQIEELADALHFFVEFCIIAGVEPSELKPIDEVVGETVAVLNQVGPALKPQYVYWATTYHLALIGNTLKNKAWKKTQMKTDLGEFKKHTINAYEALISCFTLVNWEHDVTDPKIITQEIYDFYFKKNAVNQFRQRSNY